MLCVNKKGGALALACIALSASCAVAAAGGVPSISIRHLSHDEWQQSNGREIGMKGGLLTHLRNGIQATFSQFPFRLRNEKQLVASAAAVADRREAAPARIQPTQQEQIYPVKGDGRCMFRSISRALAHAEKRPLSEKAETDDADYLRKAAWQDICVTRRPLFEQNKVIDGNMQQYCNAMKSPNFHGGEPELFVLSEQLKRTITVYVPQQGGFKAIVEYGSKYLPVRPRIRILYNGSNHYDALLD